MLDFTARDVLETLYSLLQDEVHWIKEEELGRRYPNDLDIDENTPLITQACLVGGAKLALAEQLFSDLYIEQVLDNKRQPKSKQAQRILGNDFGALLGIDPDWWGEAEIALPWGSPLHQLLSHVVALLYQALIREFSWAAADCPDPYSFTPDINCEFARELRSYRAEDLVPSDRLEQIHFLQHATNALITFNDARDTKHPQVLQLISAAIKFAIEEEATV